MSKEVKRYAERDAYELDKAGNYYCRHVSAMTGEGLHSKSDIAAELGWRDMQIDALLAERDELKRDVEILEREVKEYAGFLLLLNAVRYRLRREVGDEAFGAARLQRIFLLGYQNAAQLLRILTEKGDLVPAGEGGHQRKFAALQGEQP